jgi:hypothetical protein
MYFKNCFRNFSYINDRNSFLQYRTNGGGFEIRQHSMSIIVKKEKKEDKGESGMLAEIFKR